MLTIGIAEQRNESRPIRVVLNRLDFGGNADLVSLEIDDAVMAFVSSSAMPHRQLPVVVPPINAVLRLEQRLKRRIGRQFLLVVQYRFETERVGLWFESLDTHLEILPVFDHLFAFAQGDIRLLPVRAIAAVLSAP